jgi:predicted RNA binding protein YcfA (HicA-like mRNA interferase family)
MEVLVDRFPSMRWPQLRRILEREPLNYRIVHQEGSHRTLEAEGRPRLRLSFHDDAEIASGQIRTILVRDVGLTVDEARGLL